MLVLSRKPGERILIGNDIEIVVVEADVHRVRLGIKAPPEVRIDRSEVAERRYGAAQQRTERVLTAKSG